MATLDVRPMMAAGNEPFEMIMAVVQRLEPGEDFELLAPLEPRPLYEALGARGFSHRTEALGGGDYRVVFRSQASAAQASTQTTPSVIPAG